MMVPAYTLASREAMPSTINATATLNSTVAMVTAVSADPFDLSGFPTSQKILIGGIFGAMFGVLILVVALDMRAKARTGELQQSFSGMGASLGGLVRAVGRGVAYLFTWKCWANLWHVMCDAMMALPCCCRKPRSKAGLEGDVENGLNNDDIHGLGGGHGTGNSHAGQGFSGKGKGKLSGESSSASGSGSGTSKSATADVPRIPSITLNFPSAPTNSDCNDNCNYDSREAPIGSTALFPGKLAVPKDVLAVTAPTAVATPGASHNNLFDAAVTSSAWSVRRGSHSSTRSTGTAGSGKPAVAKPLAGRLLDREL